MIAERPWAPVEGSVAEIRAALPQPFEALATGYTPAVIVRGAYPTDACRAVVRRLYEGGCVVERPDGAYDAVGTSLVNSGADPEAFFRSAAETHALFDRLFTGLEHPVERFYSLLGALEPDRRVQTAHEPDGRRYGPGIFRLYPAGKGHDPHFDSISRREGWSHYAAAGFLYQFAAVLCLQAADAGGDAGECLLYRRFWSPELQPVLDDGGFRRLAAEQGVERAQIRLEAGDFYVFNPLNIHEVPHITGATPRIVLAAFLGYSREREEVYVWS